MQHRPLVEYRLINKIKTTYGDGLLAVINPETGRIHSSFNQTVTVTGRISSTEPNMQNIPVRHPLGREIRKMFVAKDGCMLVDADYSQIELRILAHIAQDKEMMQAFADGVDIHGSHRFAGAGDSTCTGHADTARRRKGGQFWYCIRLASSALRRIWGSACTRRESILMGIWHTIRA